MGGVPKSLFQPKPTHPSIKSEVMPVALDEVWGMASDPVELIATDSGILSRNMIQGKGGISKVINDWMDQDRFSGYRLIVKLVDEDGEPEVAFVPHSHSEIQKVLMADQDGQPGLWFLLVAGARKENPLRFHIKYRYQRIN